MLAVFTFHLDRLREHFEYMQMPNANPVHSKIIQWWVQPPNKVEDSFIYIANRISANRPSWDLDQQIY